jgi:hypothetical protein
MKSTYEGLNNKWHIINLSNVCYHISFNNILENGVTVQMWFNIPGTDLNGLTKNPRYPGKPDLSSKLLGFETQENVGDNYGVRLTTYFMVRIMDYFEPNILAYIELNFAINGVFTVLEKGREGVHII